MVHVAGGVAGAGVADGADDEVGVFRGRIVAVGDEAHHIRPRRAHGIRPRAALTGGEVFLGSLGDVRRLDHRAGR